MRSNDASLPRGSRSLSIIAVILLLYGCAPVMVAPPTATRPMQGTEGTVVLSVTGNTGRVAQFDAISIKQYVKPEPGVAPIKGEYILRQLSPGLARDTAFFVGVVPAGEYVLAKFSHDKTQRYINLNDKSIERIGHFRVTAGAVSDLGRIIVTPL